MELSIKRHTIKNFHFVFRITSLIFRLRSFFNIVQKAFEPTSPPPLKIWYNVPILPSNSTISPFSCKFHVVKLPPEQT